ncbi:ABC transporter substrate-binding protein [Mumia sp. DW29H23]|uniref:ABC transporter substrate-binding protein n=1 Tax=Mumia sp. DW29H23 TaxID=3421241 RepID=UPI003D697DD6
MSHRTIRRSRTRLRSAAVALAAVVATATLAACGGEDASADSDATTVFKLGDPGNSGVLAYAKKTGVLEKKLAEADATIEWGGSYASFTATIDAVRAGDVNVLEGAISPAIGYLSTSDDLKIFTVAPRPTDPKAPVGDGLVVPKDSDVTSIDELVGKKVAVNKGGRGEYLLDLALDDAGIAHDAVEKVYLNPVQAAGAFSSGKVDAWWAIVRGYPTAVAQGAKTIVTSNEVGDNDLTIFAARTEVVKENPEALKVFLDTVTELTEESTKEPEKFQNVFTDSGPTAVEGAALERDIEVQRYSTPFAPVTDADIATIQDVADYFFENGLISRPVEATSAAVKLGS